MKQVKQLQKINQVNYELKDDEHKPFFTSKVAMWLICFLIMLLSLLYKELFLERLSDDWRFFSAIHVIFAMICIAWVIIYNFKSQKAFDEDLSEIDGFIESVPIIVTNNRVYANSREIYERILTRFKDFILIAKTLYFFGLIVMAVVFFIWNITHYFLMKDAFVVSLNSDSGWKLTADQMYIPGLIIIGVSIIGSVLIRETVKSVAGLYVLLIHLGALMNQVLRK